MTRQGEGKISAGRFRHIVLGAFVALILAALLPGPARADHSLNQACYVCHNIKSGEVWQGSNSIWRLRPIGMPSYTRAITCEVCHTDFASKFDSSQRSKHPVRVISTNNTLADNTFGTITGSTVPYMDCLNCHGGNQTTPTPNLIPDVAPWNYLTAVDNATDGYPNHDNTIVGFSIVSGAWNAQNVYTAGTDPHLTGVGASASLYTHAPSSTPLTAYAFCFSCHDGSAGHTNRADNVLGSYTTGTPHYYKSSAPTGGALNDALACSDCHATHNSTASSRLLKIPTPANDGYIAVTIDTTRVASPNASEIRAMCNGCHTEYLAKGSSPTANVTPLIRGVRPAVRPTSVSAHSGSDTTSCYECHIGGAHNPAASCNTCHGDNNGGTSGRPPFGVYGGASPWPSKNTVDNISVPAGIGDHRNVPEVTSPVAIDCSAHTLIACTECHTTTTPGPAGTHNTGYDNATMTQISTHNWYSGALASWNGGALAAGVLGGSVTDDYCLNINCHAPYYASNVGKSGTPSPYRRYWINKTLWDCYTCHAYDGRTATSRPATGSKSDNTMSTGMHFVHVDNNLIGCNECHPVPGNMTTALYTAPHKNGLFNISFDSSPNPFPATGNSHAYSAVDNVPTDDNTAAGHRDMGYCSSVYCHSTGQNASGLALGAGDYKTPRWDNEAIGNCGTCHGGDGVTDCSVKISTGSHTRHVTTSPYSYACTMCHANSGRASTNHVDNAIDLQFGTLNAIPIDCTTYSQSKKHLVGNGFGTCTTNYCHGTDPLAANRLSGGANQAGTPNLPMWDNVNSALCGSCHGATTGSMNYVGRASNWPTSGFHARHMDATDNVGPHLSSCDSCHPSATVSTHVDGKVDFRSLHDCTVVTTLWLTQVCDPCHGTGVAAAKAQWDNTSYALDCLTCHGATAAYTYDNATGRVAPNLAGDGTNFGAVVHGHNRPTSSGVYPASANPAANLSCASCHKLTLPHINNVNDNTYAGNRLWDNVNSVTGLTTVTRLCGACHTTTGTSPAITKLVNTHGNDNASAAFKAGPTHDLNAENFAYACDACHEPHGMDNNGRTATSANVFMTKALIEVKNFTVGTGTADNTTTVGPIYFESLTGTNSFDDNASAQSSRICVACHVSGNRPGPSTRLAAIDGRHAYDNGTPLDAYGTKESGGNCASCHNHNLDDNVATNDGLMPQQCNSCHSFPGLDNSTSPRQMSLGHRDHVGLPPNAAGLANSRTYSCTICHYAYTHNELGVTAGSAWTGYNAATHLNIRFDSSWNPVNANGPRYNGVPAGVADNAHGNGGTGVCAGLYCHGNNADNNIGWGGTYSAPRWDNTGGVICDTCHLASATYATGNHPAHLVASSFGPGSTVFSAGGTCSEGTGCHPQYALSASTAHVNNQVSMKTSPSDNTPVALSATTVCRGCHATYTSANILSSGDTLARTQANWDNGSYKLPCITCHNGGVGTQAWQAIDNTGNRANAIEKTYYWNGHGATSIDNTAAGSVTDTGTGPVDQTVPVRCDACHDETSLHIGATKDTTNPWRLDAGYGTAGTLDNNCLRRCHVQSPSNHPALHSWIVTGTGSSTKDNTVKTHPTSTPVGGTGARWYRTPTLADNVPFLSDISNKATMTHDNNSVVLCVSCHDPHGVDNTGLTATRVWSGNNDNGYKMLRYRSGNLKAMCSKCHM